MNLKPLIGVITTLFIGMSAIAAPQETKETILQRNSTTGNTVRAELSLNVYRQEPYEDDYIEKVPYQATETYYEQVPYQDTETYTAEIPYEETETYTVDVPYQTTETYYEDVPYTERVPYTDYEDYYENEYTCENVTKYREECSNERVCTPGGRVCQPITECGTNARGEKICKTRNECREEGPRDCSEVPKCRKVPYTEQSCGYKSVRKSRAVTKYREEVRYRQELRSRTVTKYRQEQRTRTITKYRQEQRTRTVTKYRQEQRTRTVTKYRDEIRCCVTKYRDVFDHQFTQPVSVIFPVEAALLDGEREQIKLSLEGDEKNSKVVYTIQSNVFSYVIDQKKLEGREKVFVLKLTPKWTSENAGTSSIQGLKLAYQNGEAKVVFNDSFAAPRVNSIYGVEIRDQQSQNLLFEQRLEGNSAKAIEIPAPGLPRDGKYTVSLHVERHGVSIAEGKLSFGQTATYERKGLDATEIANLRDEKQVQFIALVGQGSAGVVTFKDMTPDIEEVKSTYHLVVWKKLANGKIERLGAKKYTREAISKADGTMSIAFKDVGVNPPSGYRVYLDIVVDRMSPEYIGPKKIQFVVGKTF